MRIVSKISYYHKGSLALLLAPFLWLQMYFHALEEWISHIVYAELFNHQEQRKYSQFTHLISFIVFSGFCLLAFYEKVDQYLALLLYLLWLMSYLSARFKSGLYVDKPAWVRLENKETHWEWSMLANRQQIAHQHFEYTQIKNVLIATATYHDESFRNQVLQIWHIHLQTQDEQKWVVYQEKTIQKALTKALQLAQQFNTVVQIAESYGTSALADFELEALQSQNTRVWHKTYLGNITQIKKSFSSMTLLRWLQLIIREIKDFLFIAILAGFMQRYGALLMALLWHKLGVASPPPLAIEISFVGVAHLFMPEFNWSLLLVLISSSARLLYHIYQQCLQHQIQIQPQQLEYSINGQQKGRLPIDLPLAMVVLKGFDATSLIIVNAENTLLEIKGLEEDEYDELYQLLLTL